LRACPTVLEDRESEAMSKSGDSKTARIVLTTLGDVAVAVMTARRMARDLGFGETDEFGIGTAVSELATNAIRYARLGEVLLQPIERKGRSGLEAVIEDKGPGIEDVDKALTDCWSTTDSLGLGLPGVKRMMDEFILVSHPDRGTRATIRKWLPARTKPYEYGIAVRPFPGEPAAGDVGLVIEERNGLFIAIVDVLGHGPEAHEVASTIVQFLTSHRRSDLCSTLEELHASLQRTRGAAAGVARIDYASGELRYAAIGNTVVRRIGPRPLRLVSRDGTLGHIHRTPREERMTITNKDVILFYTDGVRDHFELDRYPTIATDSAPAIARNIVRLFSKPHDDAACIALRPFR
jgi:anti-sigma regulatory factor (Ser/Thr protein kinase)